MGAPGGGLLCGWLGGREGGWGHCARALVRALVQPVAGQAGRHVSCWRGPGMSAPPHQHNAAAWRPSPRLSRRRRRRGGRRRRRGAAPGALLWSGGAALRRAVLRWAGLGWAGSPARASNAVRRLRQRPPLLPPATRVNAFGPCRRRLQTRAGPARSLTACCRRRRTARSCRWVRAWQVTGLPTRPRPAALPARPSCVLPAKPPVHRNRRPSWRSGTWRPARPRWRACGASTRPHSRRWARRRAGALLRRARARRARRRGAGTLCWACRRGWGRPRWAPGSASFCCRTPGGQGRG